MRNIKLFAFTMIAAMILSACGGKPSDMDDITYNLGCKALETMDAYNNMEIEKDEANDKQLEQMYEKYEKLLWKEHEDVRGDDMIEVGYAEQFLQDLLCEFGCWDEPEDNKEQ